MEKQGVVARARFRVVAMRRPRILLVDGDLGRRATLAVALGARYAVHTVGGVDEAHRRAVLTSFDGAVLDSATLGAALPPLVRLLRSRAAAVRLLIVAGRRDLRGRHYAATLGVDGRLGRRAPAHALLDRVGALLTVADPPAPFDRGVGRAIDLMASDVIHLLDVNALAELLGFADADDLARAARTVGERSHRPG